MHLPLGTVSENLNSAQTVKAHLLLLIKETLAPAVNFPLMCDFLAPLYRNSGETFLLDHLETSQNPDRVVPPERETVNV